MRNEKLRAVMESGQKLFAATSALLVLLTAGALPVNAAPKDRSPAFKQKPAHQAVKIPRSVPGQIIVTTKKGFDEDEMKNALAEVNGQIVNTIKVGDKEFTVIQVDQKEYSKDFNILRKNKKFLSVDLNNLVKSDVFPLTIPNDPGLRNQPQIFVQHINWGWKLGSLSARPGGLGQTIGIIDTGVQGTNLDLVGKVLNGRNTVTNTNTGNVDLGDGSGFFHGTFCGTLMAMNTNNGIVGASFDYNALIDPVDCFNGNEFATDADILEGFEFLANEPNVRFINISVGGGGLEFSGAYQAAVQAFCEAKNGLVFHSAGNDAFRILLRRNNFDISNGAVDSSLHRAEFSNYGPYVTFAGLGVGDGASNRDGTALINADGTSFSTPTNCSIAVNMAALNPSLSGQQILALMKLACIRLDPTEEMGFGVPDAARCADLALHTRGAR